MTTVTAHRTRKQSEANKLDLDIDRLVRRLEHFAAEHHAPEVRLMAWEFDRNRSRIRTHMHPQDREDTQ